MNRLWSNAMVTVLCLAISACTTMSKSSADSFVAVEKPVHFVSPGGGSVVVPPGTYQVRYAGDTQLQLVPEPAREPVTIQATPTSHQEQLERITAFSIPKEPDEHHVVLWMPGGLALDAAGSYSGVQSRAVRLLDQQYVQAYSQTARSSFLSGASGWPPPPSPTPDLVMTASLTPTSPTLNQAVSVRLYIINQGQADATLVQQPTPQPHISLQTFDSAGNPSGGTSFWLPTLPLTIPAGASRYVDVSAANQKWMTNRVGTFYWQFTLYSYITESNTANNVGPRMPVTVR